MKKGISALLTSILIISMIPFSLFADYSDGEFDNDSVNGVQVEEYEETLSGVQGTRYRFNIILDGFYVGNFQIHVEYDSYNVDSGNWDHYTINRTVYVCGYDTYFETWMRSNWLPPSSITWSASVNNSDQCQYVGRMESTTLLNYLIAIRNTLNNNEPVQTSFLGLIDQKIEQLTYLRQWNFPIESLSVISYFYQYYNLSLNDLFNYGSYSYPVFNLNTSFSLRSKWGNNTTNYSQLFIFAIDKNVYDISSFNSIFSLTNGSIVSITEIYRNYYQLKGYSIVKAEIYSTSSNYFTLSLLQSCNMIPIYFDYKSNKNISTDFALVYGLSNQLLDDLHIIAQGTNSSNSSVSDLDSATSDMQDSFDDFSAFENQIDTGFNNQMQNIDFTNPLTNNSGILPAANFVITIFNGLINNNPLSVLIIIVCILLIGKKIIGK